MNFLVIFGTIATVSGALGIAYGAQLQEDIRKRSEQAKQRVNGDNQP